MPVLELAPEIAAAEIDRRFDGNKFFPFANEWGDSQFEAIVSERDFIFVIGGNGAGKTEIGSWSTGGRFNGYCPASNRYFQEEPGRDYKTKPYIIYVVGTTFDDVNDRLRPSLEKWIPEDSYRVVGKSKTWVRNDGKVKILFKSIDQKARTFQGDEVDWVWCDEHPEREQIWDELKSRVFRKLGQIMVTMTAWQGVYWLFQFMFYPDQCKAERKCIVRIPVFDNPFYAQCDCGYSLRWHPDKGPCIHPRSACTGYDNRRGQKMLATQVGNFTGIMYDIRVLGHYRLMAGHNVCPLEAIEKQLEENAKEPVSVGFFNAQTQFVSTHDLEDPRNVVRIIRAPDLSSEYVIGFDSGGGNPTGDYHAAVVINVQTHEQVATMQTRSLAPREVAWPLLQLAQFYCGAFIVPEANRHGMAVIEKLMEFGYGNIYQRRVIEKIGAGITNKIGFWTDKKTKQFAVDLMVELFCHRWKIKDPLILHELYGVLYLKDNREGAHGIGPGSSSGHDDLFAALFLAAVGYHALGLLVPGDSTKDNLPPPPPVKKSMIDQIEADLAEGGVKGKGFDDEFGEEEEAPSPFEEDIWHDIDEMFGGQEEW